MAARRKDASDIIESIVPLARVYERDFLDLGCSTEVKEERCPTRDCVNI